MKRILFALFIPIIALASCGGELSSEDLLPDASGEHGHILVVMENNLWEGNMGTNLRAQLDQRCEGPYLRPEPLFNYYQKKPGTLNHVNKMSRLILKVFIDRDSTYQETAVIEKDNYWAKGQLFLVIKDSDAGRLNRFIAEDFQQVLDKMNDFELQELVAKYKSRPNNAVDAQAEEKFGINIKLPRESKLKVEKENFMWVKYDRSRNLMSDESSGARGGTFWIQEGIVFWSEPFNDSTIDPYNILEKRDTVLKHNIPGKVKGSYMATEYDPCCAPTGMVTTFKGNRCVIFRGLWKHAGRRGAAGGGPFIQYSIHNPSNNTVVTVCGYVYAPKFDKREYIRELEAMMSTIEIAE